MSSTSRSVSPSNHFSNTNINAILKELDLADPELEKLAEKEFDIMTLELENEKLEKEIHIRKKFLGQNILRTRNTVKNRPEENIKKHIKERYGLRAASLKKLEGAIKSRIELNKTQIQKKRAELKTMSNAWYKKTPAVKSMNTKGGGSRRRTRRNK